ncbi:MAG: hypothetical protein Q9178_006879 [Gyalolechia marmorata]
MADHCRGSIIVNASPHQGRRINGTTEDSLPDGSVSNLKQIEKTAIFEIFVRRGIQYQGSFATLTQISRANDSATALVDPPVFVRSQSNNSTASDLIHPTVLDGCFQVLVALILGSKYVRRPPLLNFIRALDSPNLGLMPTGDQLQLHAEIGLAGPLARNGRFEAWSSEDAIERRQLVSSTGIRITASPGLENTTTAERPHIYRNWFIPDVELLGPLKCKAICRADVSEPTKSVKDELNAFESLSLFYVQRAFHELSSRSCLAKEAEQLQHLWNWMESFVEQNAESKHPNYASWDAAEVKKLVHKVQGFGDEGRMLVRMGYNLPAILTGTAQPLPLMIEDDLLPSFYHNDSLSRCYIQMGKYLHLLGLKSPTMAILEIGAGTGGTTLSVLEALSRPRSEDGFMFESSDFTDISSGFFDKAQSLLKRWKGVMNYKRLDIEKRPPTQGFKSGYYDLVMASNVLHATGNIENTIRNVRELLKPGGKFVLLEITRLQAHLNSLLEESISLSEMEYIENEGQVTISRVLVDELATDRMTLSLDAKSPTAAAFQQGDQPLRIDDLSSESNTRMVFGSSSNASGSLGNDEIEILPQYISITARNGDHRFGRSGHAVGSVRECSGTVRRVGSTYRNPFKVGDRVIAAGSGPVWNHFRASADTVHPIPLQLSYEEAISIPVILVTALYFLKHIAKAQGGDSILIYQEAQMFGQAVITLAQFMDLDVYAEVDLLSEQTLLTERFGIPVAHTFYRSKANTSDPETFGESNADCYFLETNCDTVVKEQREDLQTPFLGQDAAYIVAADGSGAEYLVASG